MKNIYLAFLLVWPSLILAQTTTPPKNAPDRDPQAVQVLARTLAAMRTEAAANSVRTTEVHGHVEFAPDIPGQAGDFSWKWSDNEFRYENPGGTILVSGQGKPARSFAGAWKKSAAHLTFTQFPVHMPAFALSKGSIPNKYSVKYLGDSMVHGRPAEKIEIHLFAVDDDDGFVARLTSRVWYIDQQSNLPLRVEFNLPDETFVTHMGRGVVDYLEYKQFSAIQVPTYFTLTIDDQTIAEYTINAAEFPSALPASDFVGGAK